MRLCLVLAVILSLALAVVSLYAARAYSQVSSDLPSLDMMVVLLDGKEGLLYQPTRLYDRTGEHVLLVLDNPDVKARSYEELDNIPQSMIHATLASTEGDDPYETLAGQLVRDFLLWAEPKDQRRDQRQELLADQVIDEFGEEKVLEWYLNSANYGQQAYGVAAAARVYFGKQVLELTLAEAALLAASAQAPELNPIDAPQLTLEKQENVLQAMLTEGYISTEEALQANVDPIEIYPSAFPKENIAPAFSEIVLEQLNGSISKERLYRGGLQIITTLDYDLQVQANCTVQTHLVRVSGGQIRDIDNCEGARLLPTLARQFAPVKVDLDANIVVLDSTNGQILTLTGENASALAHPPGSVLTPFVYLAGFTRGFGPASLLWDIPNSIPSALEDAWDPSKEFHGPVRARIALANDYLAAALQMMVQIGPENAWRTARQSGVYDLPDTYGIEGYAFLLGGGQANILQVAHAYSIFSNQGVLSGQMEDQPLANGATPPLIPPAVLKVQDYSGRVWLDWSEADIRPVVTSQLAYLITHVLSDEVSRWPSLGHPNPLEIGRPAGVKIGQTFNKQDIWTVGYTPQRVVAVWVGVLGDQTDEQIAESEPPQLELQTATNLWHALAKYTHLNLSPRGWESPSGIITLNVCDPSGLLPTEDCPNLVPEVFASGSEPTQRDNLYKVYYLNRQTGLLATVFTPIEYIEEKVFIRWPMDALEWALENGKETPPEDYDAFFTQQDANPEVDIQSPAMFAYVNGEVTVKGSAFGEDFSLYRIQVGEGLNPRQWLQIGENISTAVEDGRLVVWNTEGLNGLYAIRLQVVMDDSSVQSAVTQVTIDNQPPDVQITYPKDGQALNYPDERDVLIQVQVSDNIDIGQVTFIIDGSSFLTLREPPFIAFWQGTIGEHRLEVEAFDLAGNGKKTEVTFGLQVE
jgi:membrane carboxypeptidase/penicillin-binding protein